MQHMAFGEVHHLCAAQPMQAEHDPAANAAHGEVHAPALAWPGADRCREDGIGVSAAAQRGPQKVGLPGDVCIIAPVLQHASAACAEMRAGRFDTRGAWIGECC
jgi:hypothetical protein